MLGATPCQQARASLAAPWWLKIERAPPGNATGTTSPLRIERGFELSPDPVEVGIRLESVLDHLGDVIRSAKIRFVVVSNVPCSWLIFPCIDPRLREGEGGWFSEPLVPSWRY
jgi:hypothetical protein